MLTERKADRRKGASHFISPQTDRRRQAHERRGTVSASAPLTREQQLFGERRAYPRER